MGGVACVRARYDASRSCRYVYCDSNTFARRRNTCGRVYCDSVQKFMDEIHAASDSIGRTRYDLLVPIV